MKARLPDEFQLFASQFNLESMLFQVSKLSYSIAKNPATSHFLGETRYYSYNNRRLSVLICQTWLIDLVYDLCQLRQTGNIIISKNEVLHLVNLYNKVSNKKPNVPKDDFLLYVFGFMGEQIEVQAQSNLLQDFARENCILEEISKRESQYKIDICAVFKSITGWSPFEYSVFLMVINGLFLNNNGIASKSFLNVKIDNPLITSSNLYHIIKKYSIGVSEVKNHPLKRQVFYSLPFIETDSAYVSSNAFVSLNTFAHSNYWVLRNHFNSKKSQDFINVFGKYFELYFEELLQNCINTNEYDAIDTCGQKRADWLLTLFGQSIIVEQKSALALLGTKQNNSDVSLTKQYILKTWKKAVQQLQETETALKLHEPTKIILSYENYLPCECLDELFKMDSSLQDDGRYWLVTIDEIERFLYLYKTNPSLAEEVFKLKKSAELSKDSNGRSLEVFLENKGVSDNLYLKEFDIYQRFDRISSFLENSGDEK